MFNMRIDIIRKELERRFKEVGELKNRDYKEVEEAISRFLYFLLSEPVTKDFILELSRYDEDFIKSYEFIEIKEKVADTIKTIIGEIDSSGMVDEDYKKRFRSKHPTLTNLFDLPDPDIRNEYLSLDKFLQALRNFDQYSGCILNDFHHLMNHLKYLFENDIYYDNSKTNTNVIADSINNIRGINLVLEAKFRYQAEYDSANSLHRLLNCMTIGYRFLLWNIRSELGEEKYFRSDAERHTGTVSESEYLVRDCRNVYHAIDKFLSTSKSKSFLIDRLITYSTWIKREDFPKSKMKTKWGNEKKVSKIVEEFMFNHGYFPLVDFKMGKSKPDILSVPGMNVRWDNSVLIELKQSIGESYTSGKLSNHITQAKRYLSTIRGAKQDIVDKVYLLVFYNEKSILEIDKSYRDECEKNNVRIELIYVGKQSPSKLTKTKILKAPKTTPKKKLPKKKAAKKASRKNKSNA